MSDYRNAHSKVRAAIKRGALVRPSVCSECFDTPFRIEAHHDDYAKPLDVRWLCQSCHKLHHLNERFMAKVMLAMEAAR